MRTKRIKVLFESKVFFYYPRVSVRELFVHTSPRFVVTYNLQPKLDDEVLQNISIYTVFVPQAGRRKG